MSLLTEPLSQKDASRLAKAIIQTGVTTFSQHARDEMKNDNLTDTDVANVVRGGYCELPGELVHGTWRYRLRTQRIVVVVAFRSDTEMRVVTAWRVVQ